jgi:hypothetical protein
LNRTGGVFVNQVLGLLQDLGHASKVFNFVNVEETGIFQEFRSQIFILLGIEHSAIHEAREFLYDFKLVRLGGMKNVNMFYILG